MIVRKGRKKKNYSRVLRSWRLGQKKKWGGSLAEMGVEGGGNVHIQFERSTSNWGSDKGLLQIRKANGKNALFQNRGYFHRGG